MKFAEIIGADAAARWRRAGGVALVLLALALYAPSWRAPFIFDDQAAIVNNATLRWHPPWTPLFPPAYTGVSGRPLVNLSFALNYLVSGGSPWSYHLGNMLLHGAAAWLLFSLVRRLLALAQPEVPAGWLAWSIAAAWVAHPLQTESVSCVVQRTEVLASCFYLATLLAFVRSLEPGAWPHWRAASVAACLAGMASKEIVATAPLAVLLLDRAFGAGSFAAAWRGRRRYYLALAATWLLLGALVASHGGTRGGVVGFGTKLGVVDNLLTQAKAVTLYLRLSFWPHPLVLDYGEQSIADFREALPPGLLLAAALAATGWLLVKRPRPACAAALFFVLLAPSSSIVPLSTQPIAEHRMYLPLACVVVLVAAGLRRLTRFAPWLLLAGVVPLGWATVARNQIYRDPLALWQHSADTVPANARARIHVGNALLERGLVADAETEFRRALELQPGFPTAILNVGSVLLFQGRAREALPFFEAGVRTDPQSAPIRLSYGATLMAVGREAEAFAQYEAAVRLAPDSAPARYEYAISLLQRRRVPEAVEQLRRSATLDPKYVPPRRMLERLGYDPRP